MQTRSSFAVRARHALLVSLLAVASSGCVTMARFDVVRPALLDASQAGNTFTVQPFGGVDATAAYQVQAMLQQRISSSLNPAIRLLASGGGVIVTGDVVDFSYREEIGRVEETCSRQVEWRDRRGETRTRTESYPCIRNTRYGYASAAVRFVVMVASTGQVVFDRTYQDATQAETAAIDGPPPGIDGRYLLDGMVESFVASFSRVILPWRETVEVAFTGCGGADGCGEAFDRIRAGDLQTAEQIYTQILGPYDSPDAELHPDDTDIVAETLFNRGIIRAYTGSYELGIQDLTRAVEIRPNEWRWRQELAQVEQLAEEQEALQRQMGQALAGSAVQPM